MLGCPQIGMGWCMANLLDIYGIDNLAIWMGDTPIIDLMICIQSDDRLRDL